MCVWLLVRHIRVHLVDRWQCWLCPLLDLLQVREVIWEEEVIQSLTQICPLYVALKPHSCFHLLIMK